MILGEKIISEMVRGNNIQFASETIVRENSGTGERVISYGVGYAGYDLRLGNKFAIFLDGFSISRKYNDWLPIVRFSSVSSNGNVVKCVSIDSKLAETTSVYIDPLNIEKYCYKFTVPDGYLVVLGPLTSVLCETVEYINMPSSICGMIFGKSTYARCGLVVNATPVEPGWSGRLVIELYNNNRNNHVVLRVGQGIAQVMFVEVNGSSSYSGRWQNQHGIDSMTDKELVLSAFGCLDKELYNDRTKRKSISEQLKTLEQEEDDGRWNWWGIDVQLKDNTT